MISQILLSSIIHKRFIPFKHTLKYKVPSLFINLDNLDELSKKYKISRERIRQIETKAFEKLQKSMINASKSKNLLTVN